jgi:hypothetical protein
MFTILKALCLAVYAVAILANSVAMPEWLASGAQMLAIIMLLAHVAETFFFWRYVKMWQGPLIGSFALTLLFGILHWKPIQDDE